MDANALITLVMGVCNAFVVLVMGVYIVVQLLGGWVIDPWLSRK